MARRGLIRQLRLTLPTRMLNARALGFVTHPVGSVVVLMGLLVMLVNEVST